MATLTGNSIASTYTQLLKLTSATLGADASANVGMSIISNNANQGTIFFGDEDDTDIGGIIYNHSDNSMSFQTNTNTDLKVTGAGLVEMGVTHGYAKLAVDSGTSDGYAGYFATNNAVPLASVPATLS